MHVLVVLFTVRWSNRQPHREGGRRPQLAKRLHVVTAACKHRESPSGLLFSLAFCQPIRAAHSWMTACPLYSSLQANVHLSRRHREFLSIIMVTPPTKEFPSTFASSPTRVLCSGLPEEKVEFQGFCRAEFG